MRTLLTSCTLALALCGAALLTSCGGDAPTEQSANATYACPMHPEVTGKAGDNCTKCGMPLEAVKAKAEEHRFACPMHPDVTGKEGDKCPKCGMALEHHDEAMNMDHGTMPMAYHMVMKMDPAAPEAGKPVMLSFTPKKDADANAQVPLDVMHTKKVHLILASSDLSYYTHLHPEYQADGSYTVSTTLPAGGDYILFADYTPSGASNTVNRMEITASGAPAKGATYDKERLTSTVDGYSVSLTAEAGTFYSRGMNHMGAPIKKGAKTVDPTTLEDIMGVKGHLVIISADGQRYLHVHPEMEDGQLDLHTEFKEPGLYRGFFQFQTGGVVHTADFVINVKDGEVPAEEGEAGDGHADHDHGAEKEEHAH